MKKIKIKYHGTEKIAKIPQGDWIDLKAAESVHLAAGEFKYIDLGVSMQLPRRYEAYVVPRSSTFKNFKIIQANSIGIIDNSFCGDEDIWKFPALAIQETDIKKGDRICQFRIMKKQPNIRFNIVEFLKRKNRGGFGSTGK